MALDQDKLIAMLRARLFELDQKEKTFTGNSTSRRIVRGKMGLLKEILKYVEQV